MNKLVKLCFVFSFFALLFTGNVVANEECICEKCTCEECDENCECCYEEDNGVAPCDHVYFPY